MPFFQLIINLLREERCSLNEEKRTILRCTCHFDFITPFNVTVLIPSLLIFFFDYNLVWDLKFPYNILLYIMGALWMTIGLVIMISTIFQFAENGKGTLAPWNPPQKLVVNGLYRYTRNPMISGVVFILFGEVIILGS